MDKYVPLHAKGIPKSKIPSIKSFTNRHGARLIEDSIRPEEPEGNYFSADIVVKRRYEEDIVKGILGPGYAKEVLHLNEEPSKFDYAAIQGD